MSLSDTPACQSPYLLIGFTHQVFVDACAALRPEAMHFTTNDAPVEASPAANTLSTELCWRASALTLPRWSFSTPSCSSSPSATGFVKPIASSTSWAGIISFLPEWTQIHLRPVSGSLSQLTSSISTSLTCPSLPMNLRVSRSQRRVHPSS